MSEAGLGLDFLGAKPWSALIVPGKPIAPPKSIQAGLPTALLPLQRGEKPLTGEKADTHRRGRALAWPPEAQVPPLGNPANGSGRIPLCALFEMLCAGEKEWGKLPEQTVAWRPDGSSEVSIGAAKLIAQQVDDFAKPNQQIALVVPDSLGVGGQQAILSAVRSSKLVLVPRSIAAVIGYCRASESNLPKGHITVVDTSFGAWSVAQVPVDVREGPKGDDWNVPVSDARRRLNKLAPAGWGILRKALRTPLSLTLAEGWAAEALAGKAKISSASTETFLRLQEADYPWQAPLIGESSLTKSLEEITQATESIACESPYKRNLGLIVIGPLAKARFDGVRLGDLIQARLELDRIEVDEEMVAAGAAWAAAGTANDWPTWLEQMESLELHYVRLDESDNLINDWKEVLPGKLVDAGKEYINPEPITGLKLKAGSDLVLMTMKRPSGLPGDDCTYREISTAPGKINKDDVSLTVSVRARPGQGFAVVRVSSREPGLFDSVLDWQSMRPSGPPKPPPKGYIEKAVTLKPAPELWNYAVGDLTHLLRRLEENASGNPIVFACKNAAKRLNKALTCANYNAGFRKAVPVDEFTLYTPMGRDTHVPDVMPGEGVSLLLSIGRALQEGMRRNPHERKAVNWIKKTAGWWYLGCPQGFVNDAIEDIKSPYNAVEEMSLHIAGLCLQKDPQFTDFYVAFVRKVSDSSAPNNWLKALRNLIKYNEFALKCIDVGLAEKLLQKSKDMLQYAVDGGRPQITYNALESVFFMLKYRRYQRAFASPGELVFNKLNSLGFRIFFSGIQQAFGSAQTMQSWKFLLRRAVNHKRTSPLKLADRLAIEEAIEKLRFDEVTCSPAIDAESRKLLFVIGKHIESNELKKPGRLAFAFVQFLNWDGDNEGLGQFLEGDDD